MRVLLLTPPMTQINTPYPATAYLTGFLKTRNVDVRQADPAIELVSRLFSWAGLERVARELKSDARARSKSKAVTWFLKNEAEINGVADSAIRFLQGKDPSLAMRIASRNYLPEGPRSAVLNDAVHAEIVGWAFGALGIDDRARYHASLFVDDLADLVRDAIDPGFGLSRYAEKLATSSASFDALASALARPPTVVDELLQEITSELISAHHPDLVGLSVPFPGNVYGALRIAQTIKAKWPQAKIAMGGGYVNTELRALSDPRVFDFVDYVLLDDGERPLECLIEHLEGKRPREKLFRTFVRANGAVRFCSDASEHDIPFRDAGTPTYEGLPLDKYIPLIEMLNPMHRLWSDTRWNKATLAHGCYWRKCNFCDTSLDYIGRYDPASADLVIDRMSSLARETGFSGFHFVDEAAPPALLKALSERLLERKLTFSWWGNIRFEKTFTPALANLMSRAGCIAVSGGLEVASDRLLKLMNKGVTVEQVARVTRVFREAGVLVHAYLMYGFPTETEQETIDSLERVRQLFAFDCIQSAYWHRFSMTAHSPIGLAPERFGIQFVGPAVARDGNAFARNDLEFDDPTDVDHDRLGAGLNKALYNFMHGVGLDQDVRVWFDGAVPRAKVAKNLVRDALRG